MAGQTVQHKTANNPNSTDPLEVAKRAAANKQPDEMIVALATSHYFDGLKSRLWRNWHGRMPESELDECIAVAVDSAYDAVRQGRSIGNLGAWLWKAASNRASDCWREEYASHSDVEIEGLKEAEPIDDGGIDDGLAEHRRAEAIRLARRLLPRIGQGQIVEVMELVINAVEQGIEDLPPAAIAATLGLSEPAVRSLLSRGFERLAREARREGIELPIEVPEFAPSEDNDNTQIDETHRS
jgi:DNA-directed RNA polymerase specialized sigma24 family protein